VYLGSIPGEASKLQQSSSLISWRGLPGEGTSLISCAFSASANGQRGRLSMLDRYFVVLHDGQWKISHCEKHGGPYASQKAAITAAVARARMAAKKGRQAQVMVQGENHSFREEWTYGHDPYPPEG
jgi:hypothetical protein